MSSCFQSYNSFSYNNDMAKTCIPILHYTYFFCYCYSNKLWSISYYSYNICVLVLTVTGSIQALIWLHWKKNKLTDKTLILIQTTNILLQSLLPPPAVFAISIAISFVNRQIAQYFWLVIILQRWLYERYIHIRE